MVKTYISPKLKGILAQSSTHYNLSVPQLVEQAIQRGEGQLSSTGALSVQTGKYTGRSPNDRFIVEDDLTRTLVAWGDVNVPMTETTFNRLYDKVVDYLSARDQLFVFQGFVGANPTYQMPIQVITELAGENLFARQLFIRPSVKQLSQLNPEFTVIAVPGLKAIPQEDLTNSEAFIAVSFSKRVVLVGGTGYAGEVKKSIFSVMNYILPQKGVLPMHCSANESNDGSSALFFGLSGTGKTTLSTDPLRRLVGDDEHGWSDEGIFNLEGGCYAKGINLSAEFEPQIWNAIKFGAYAENVVLDPATRIADYDDGSLTENTRVAYPLEHIPGRVDPSVSGHPSAVVFLTADAFGVLPPVSVLTGDQVMYHFLSGYTSKLAGTERGITEPEATFSACFGEPFLPLNPHEYAKMLKERVEKHGVQVYLINTGWSGGPYGVGKRISIDYTRKILNNALDGTLSSVETRIDPVFNLKVPMSCPGVPNEVLNPRQTWDDPAAYDRKALELAEAFQNNFRKKYSGTVPELHQAGPQIA